MNSNNLTLGKKTKMTQNDLNLSREMREREAAGGNDSSFEESEPMSKDEIKLKKEAFIKEK